MGCSPCEKKRLEREAALKQAQESGQVGPSVTINFSNSCIYTQSQLTNWKKVLDCAFNNQETEGKDTLANAGLTVEQYGIFIGIINYAIDNPDEPECKYADQLSQILQYVHILVALGC